MYHNPVMLKECIEGLQINPDGIYVDVTFGGGGHSMVILENLREGRLIAFDQDEDAKRQADNIQSRSFTFCQANFRYMKQYLKLSGVIQVDGILADLGISSHQIDSPERGFSTRFEGPLDMRMDQKGNITAAKILNEYPEAELHKIFGMYGELKNARTAAKAVIAARTIKPLSTTLDLKAALQQITPRGKENKYFAQVFQALRIEVNHELDNIKSLLATSYRLLNPGGRMVCISFHSLEDRIVKNFFKNNQLEILTPKPVCATPEEIQQNPSSRSAKLRAARKNAS